MSEPVVVRKYENRRLYDTSSSRYVNLPEIAQCAGYLRAYSQIHPTSVGDTLTNKPRRLRYGTL